MSAEKAFLYGLISLFACGFAWIIMEPILSTFMPIFALAGGKSAFVAGILSTAFDYSPILAIIMIAVGVFMGAMRDVQAAGGMG